MTVEDLNNAFHIKTCHGRWMNKDYELGLFSVIIPTYNRAQVLSEALDSVRGQTYRPIELLIVDDGSNDDTKDLLRNWGARYEEGNQFRIKYFLQENKGAPASRNLGLIESKGEYILFLDSDDILYPDMLVQVVEKFSSTSCDLVHVGYEKICAECKRYLYQYVPEPVQNSAIVAYMRGKIWGHTSALVRRRNLALAVGPWNEKLIFDDDGDYMCRTVLLSPKMEIVRQRLFGYMVRPLDKITDIRHTIEAWQCKLQREVQFCKGIKNIQDIPMDARQAYAGFLYAMAMQLCGAGFVDIGNGYGKLADGIFCTSLTPQGRRMRAIWKSGHVACQLYQAVRRLRRRLKDKLNRITSVKRPCSCCER